MSDTNTGRYNSGDHNSGNRNYGNRNSGKYNSGHYNSGDCNSGDCNSGDCNSGDCNSGYRNSGSYNSGQYNSGHYNSGFFNTGEPDKIRIFNTWVDMTPSEFYKKHNTYIGLPINTWVVEGAMTDAEKEENSGWEKRGGYLKTLGYKEAWAKWWEENPDERQKFLDLPHFDAEIFKEITGIDVEKKTVKVKLKGGEIVEGTIIDKEEA